MSRRYLGHGAGQLAPRTPEIDLERQRIETGAALGHPLQRRV